MNVLFIDDERRRMDAFAMELELTGKTIRFCTEAKKGWDVFVKNRTKINLIILDIMMAPGELFVDTGSVEDGLRTGIVLFEKIREQEPDIPVIIFTNASDRDVRERFRNEKNCLFVQKKGYLPHEFVHLISRFLAGETITQD